MKNKLNTIFRIVVIATLVSAVISFASVFKMAMEVVEGHVLTKEIASSLTTGLEFYIVTFVLMIASIVFSIVCFKYHNKVFAVGRTLFMGVALFVHATSLGFVKKMYPVSKAFRKLDFKDESDLRNIDPEDLDLSRAEMDAFEGAIDMNENTAELFVLALIVAVLIFGILAITSIVSLVKSKKAENTAEIQ